MKYLEYKAIMKYFDEHTCSYNDQTTIIFRNDQIVVQTKHPVNNITSKYIIEKRIISPYGPIFRIAKYPDETKNTKIEKLIKLDGNYKIAVITEDDPTNKTEISNTREIKKENISKNKLYGNLIDSSLE